MEKILHRGFRYETVPENYVFPPEARHNPQLSKVSESVPVIDLAGAWSHGPEHDHIVKQIFEAGKEFGIFQVINHGIPEEILSDIMTVTKEFFDMPAEERAMHYSDDLYKPVRVFTSTGVHDVVRFWRDCLRMAIHPVEEFEQYWPEKPENLKNIVRQYSTKIKALTEKVLQMVAEGLGLAVDYFDGELSGEPLVSHVNFYPECPKPSLTLGLAKHCDPGLVTFLLQGEVTGLQIMRHGEWIAVDPLPNAIVVNFGHQMEIISNGILEGVEHRAITNDRESRLSIATFVQPAKESIVAPAAALIHEHAPPIYEPYTFQKYFINYVANLGDKEKAAGPFLVQSN